MTKKREEQLRRLERLLPKYRINFGNDQGSQKWPAEHRKTFEEIQKLGDVKFDSYPVDTADNARPEPWKLEVKSLATQLVERAGRCVRRNEASWRFYCEHVVFARLSAEVACRECRKRIWRSEIEASTGEDSGRARALKRRRLNREPCRCPRGVNQRQDPHEVVGLNPIFTHREEERILHDTSLQKDIIQVQKPDSVYGLRKTRNFEETLHELVKDGSRSGEAMVYELLKVSPLKNEGDPILFPFLILEAKAAKAANDWDSIKLQTAFPIRTLLDVQQNLRAATRSKSQWGAGPLVWFFMNRGEDWRLCAAFVEEGTAVTGLHGSIDYHIIDLWAGSISTKNGALELLLIVGYICDWARDVYRDAVLTELRILSAGTDDNISVLPDSDIFSSRDLDFPVRSGQAEGNIEGLDPIFNEFTKWDSPIGIVRHAAFFESRFCTLFITNDNVQTLIQSTNDNIVQTFSRQILDRISTDCVFLDVETLDAIEEQWTGKIRYSRPFNVTQTKFYAVFLYSAYMSPFWQQIRELYVIAVAENAFDSIVEASKLRQKKGKALKPQKHDVDKEYMTKQVSTLRSYSGYGNLFSVINRVALRICQSKFRKDDGLTRDLVHYVYKKFKKGNLEPSEPFLLVSNRCEQQKKHELSPNFAKNLEVSKSGAVLLYGSGRTHDPKQNKQSDICLYIVEGAPKPPHVTTLKIMLKDTFENNDVYHTTRDIGTSNIKSTLPRFYKAVWNLTDNYGIYTYRDGFIRWFRLLGLEVPTRQGSPRESSSCGCYLLERSFTPWADPRRIHADAERRQYLLYKLSISEIRHWRKLAQGLKDRGISCCSACARRGVFAEELCSVCVNELEAPEYPRWVSDALIGKDPVVWSPTDDIVWSDDSHAEDWNSTTERWYKDISEYPKLNEEPKDLAELYQQASDYHKYNYNSRMKAFKSGSFFDQPLEPMRSIHIGGNNKKRNRWSVEDDSSSATSSSS